MRGRAARLDRLPRAVDVAPARAREPADDRRVARGPAFDRASAHLLGDRPHRREVVGRRGREARLDDVDPEPRERSRDLELLGRRHRRARRLLAVAQRRVEDAYVPVRSLIAIALILVRSFARVAYSRADRPSPGRGTASSRAASRRPARCRWSRSFTRCAVEPLAPGLVLVDPLARERARPDLLEELAHRLARRARRRRAGPRRSRRTRRCR